MDISRPGALILNIFRKKKKILLQILTHIVFFFYQKKKEKKDTYVHDDVDGSISCA